MAGVKLQATTTATVTTSIKLSPKVKKMILERSEEHAKLAAVVKAAKGTKKKPGRMKRIENEVQDLVQKEGQGEALMDGIEIEGHKMKMVCGHTKKFDQVGFMKHYGLSQADFDKFTAYVPSTPYMKMSAPGEEDEE